MEHPSENLEFKSFLVDRRKLLIIKIIKVFFIFWVMLAISIGCKFGRAGIFSPSYIISKGSFEKIHRDRTSMVVLILLGCIAAYGLISNNTQEPKKGEIILNEKEIILNYKEEELKFVVDELENIIFKIVFQLQDEKEIDKEFSFQSGVGNHLKINYLGKEIKEEFILTSQKMYLELLQIIQHWQTKHIKVEVEH